MEEQDFVRWIEFTPQRHEDLILLFKNQTSLHPQRVKPSRQITLKTQLSQSLRLTLQYDPELVAACRHIRRTLMKYAVLALIFLLTVSDCPRRQSIRSTPVRLDSSNLSAKKEQS